MSCSPSDLKDFFLDELGKAERERVKQHLEQCEACREELDRLRLTESALHALREEELPRRIAFVSDKVLAPRWWERLWASGPRLGFAAAAMLSVAILVHAFVRPVAPAPAVAQAAMSDAQLQARIDAEVAKRIGPAVSAAVAASETRQAEKTIALVKDAEKRFDLDRRADRAAIEDAFTVLQKKLSMYIASASYGGQP